MNAPRVRPRNLCYLEIPAVDMHESAQFCECVFAWNIRFRETERPRFDDTNGDVSGAWVTGRVSSRQPGILPYVMVADATAVAKKIVDAKGSIVPPAGRTAPRFSPRSSTLRATPSASTRNHVSVVKGTRERARTARKRSGQGL